MLPSFFIFVNRRHRQMLNCKMYFRTCSLCNNRISCNLDKKFHKPFGGQPHGVILWEMLRLSKEHYKRYGILTPVHLFLELDFRRPTFCHSQALTIAELTKVDRWTRMIRDCAHSILFPTLTLTMSLNFPLQVFTWLAALCLSASRFSKQNSGSLKKEWVE